MPSLLCEEVMSALLYSFLFSVSFFFLVCQLSCAPSTRQINEWYACKYALSLYVLCYYYLRTIIFRKVTRIWWVDKECFPTETRGGCESAYATPFFLLLLL